MLQKLANRIAGLKGWRRALLSCSAGAASVAAFAPVYAWPVMFLTMPVLAFLLDGAAMDETKAKAASAASETRSRLRDHRVFFRRPLFTAPLTRLGLSAPFSRGPSASASPPSPARGEGKAEPHGVLSFGRRGQEHLPPGEGEALVKWIGPRGKWSALRSRLRHAVMIGWWFGFGFFLAGLYWIGEAFFVEPDKFLWAMPAAVAGLPAGLAFFYAAACALAAFFWRPGGMRIVALAASFFVMEWLRGHILTGFPWNLPGYALTSNDFFLQSASLIGVYGLTFFAVLIFASPAAFVTGGVIHKSRSSWGVPALSVMLLAAAGIWGAWRLHQAGHETVPGVLLRIVQANIPQAEKWKPENRQWIFDRYLHLSQIDDPAAKGVSHIIWPESSVPFLFMADGQIYDIAAAEAIKPVIPQDGALILGAERATTHTGEDGKRRVDKVFNTLFVLNDRAKVDAFYDKVHLVPFGEYLPFPGFFRSLGFSNLTHQAQGFASGSLRHSIASAKAPPFSPLICYEAIFPGAARPAGEDVQWLLNLTNDAWFGQTSGPYQHLQQARVRAVEEGLAVVRAANTGISAVIDPYGRFLGKIPLNQIGTLDSALPSPVRTVFFTTSGYLYTAAVLLLAMLALWGVIKLD